MTTHAFTVDVEDYFHVSAFTAHVDRATWSALESRVERNTDVLLDLLATAETNATFFVLGWVAERYPQIVKKIASAGHEIASHGYAHTRVMEQTPTQFTADICRAKSLLEDITGLPVLGYRAPSFSIVPETEWALPLLVESGHRYDSSRFPIRRRGYGSPNVQVNAHLVTTASGPLWEIPLSVVRLFGTHLPVAGGGWFRQFPEWVTSLGLNSLQNDGRHGVFYIHPWEIDSEQPRFDVPWLTKVRHYRGLGSCEARLRRLLSRFTFSTIQDVFPLVQETFVVAQ
jgi:polysaccharide deacetylase family protein (PEP-CTERM system associated)